MIAGSWRSLRRRTLVLPGVPLPDRLHLLVAEDGSPITTSGDHGSREYTAYSVRSMAGGPTSVRRTSELRRLETGMDLVWVDPGTPSGAGLPLTFEPGRRRPRPRPRPRGSGVTTIDAHRLPPVLWRLRMLAALDSADRAVQLLERPGRGAPTIVLSRDPAHARTEIAAALEGLPHPTIVFRPPGDDLGVPARTS